MRYLEVEVIDGGKSTEAVIAQAEIRIISLSRHVKSQQERVLIDTLRQAIQYSRD